jgi:hypothetical protein
VNSINDVHATCVQDSDCVDAEPYRPSDWTDECVPVTICRRRLVNVNEAEAFWAETREQLSNYCLPLNCGFHAQDQCAGPSGEPGCVDGICRFRE